MAKPLLYLCLLLALVLGVSGCDLFQKEPEEPEAEAKVFSNGSDPRIAQVVRSDGKVVTFFGARDVNGMPTKLMGYTVGTPDDTQVDYVTFDQQGRYSNMAFHTGEQIQFQYTREDSVVIAVSQQDSISVFKMPMTQTARYERPAKTQANDNVIKIKVVARNAAGSEKDVPSARISVKMLTNTGKTYPMLASYTGSGVYTIPVPSAFTSTDPELGQKSLEMIKNALEVACYAGCLDEKKCPNVAKTVTTSLCLLPHRAAKFACAALTASLPAIMYVCDRGGENSIEAIGQAMKGSIKLINEYNVPDDAIVEVTSNEFEYGMAKGAPIVISAVINSNKTNPSRPYDVKITHEDISIVGQWNFTFQWSGLAARTASMNFRADHTFRESSTSFGGVWIQQGKNIGFTYTNATMYRGTYISNKQVMGTMVDGTAGNTYGRKGFWSVTR